MGEAVAERLGRTFLDLDQEIERREGRSIGQIFGEKGEPYFRKKEEELTAELTLVGNMVIAPGGGWVTNPRNIAKVRPPSKLVYLRVSPDAAIKRLGPLRGMRPLLSRPDPLGELERLLRERKAAYQSADAVVDTELYALQRVIEIVVQLAPGVG